MPNVIWKPISTAPWGVEVLLTGASGYVAPHDKFITSGYRVHDWHNDAWNDVTGTRLSENGWVPSYWAEKPALPEPK